MDRQKQRYSNSQSNPSFQPPSYRQAGFDRINPGRAELHSSSDVQKPLIGVIDQGFGAGQHGAEVLEVISQDNPQASTWLGQGVGTGTWAKTLTEFVDAAKTSGHSQAVANLSFDLIEQHSDGSVRTRSQLTAEEQQALTYARDNGVLIVASAGNTGEAMSALGQASEQFDNIIAVGAVEGHERASYSSYGNGLDLVAPGHQAGDSLMGTSRSTAVVIGAISQIWAANPALNYQQVTRVLESTATDLQTPGWDIETGAGLLNSTAAIHLAQSVTPDTQIFSGAQLIQPVNYSANYAPWKGINGAIAGERLAWSWSDVGHATLDVLGTIDPTPISDGVNAAWYAAEGDYASAAISAASMIPGGDIAKVGKWAAKGAKAAKEVKVTTHAAQPIRRTAPLAPRTETTLTRPIRIHPARSSQANGTPNRTLNIRTSTGTKLRERAGTQSSSTRSQRDRSEEATPIEVRQKPRQRSTQSSTSRKPQSLDDSRRSDKPRSTDQPNGVSRSQGGNPKTNKPRSTNAASTSQPNYQIQRGDTLWEIAQARLGDGARWRELRKPDGNTFTEQEARRLQPGETIVVPRAKSESPKSPWTPAPRQEVDPTPHIQTTRDLTHQNDSWLQSQLYRIRPGESLSDFANRIKARIWDRNSNPLSEAELNNHEQSAQDLRDRLTEDNSRVNIATKSKGAKTFTMTSDGAVFRSGWAEPAPGENLITPDQVRQFMLETGTPLGFSGNLDFGYNKPYPSNFQEILEYLDHKTPSKPANFDAFAENVGNYFASHAERQALVHALQRNPEQPVVEIGLLGPASVCDVNTDRNPGVGCRDFLADAAQHTGKTIIVAEHIISKGKTSEKTWIFHPDGSVSEKPDH